MLVWRKVSALDKIFFAKHLMMLVQAGITLPDAIDIIADQTKSDTLKEILQKVSYKVGRKKIPLIYTKNSLQLPPIFSFKRRKK